MNSKFGATEQPAALAVVPARGGSKRLPRKNVLPLAGKPLLAYTLEAALGSGVFKRVVVSTDDEEIAELAVAFGAEAQMRDRALADDHTPSSEVTLATLAALGGAASYPLVAQLLPNCPLRDADDVRSSLRAFVASKGEFQLSVANYGWQNPWWAMQRDQSGIIQPLFTEAIKSRSQDLPELYCPTGAIWLARSHALEESHTFYGPGVRGEPLDWEHALDIDHQSDLDLAEAILVRRAKEHASSDDRCDSGREPLAQDQRA